MILGIGKLSDKQLNMLANLDFKNIKPKDIAIELHIPTFIARIICHMAYKENKFGYNATNKTYFLKNNIIDTGNNRFYKI